MKIKVIYPSRQRPHLLMGVLWKWISRASNAGIEFFVSVDTSDHALTDYKFLVEKQKFGNVTLLIGDNKSAVEAINKAAYFIDGSVDPKENFLFVVISDDFNEVPEYWDVSLLREVKEKQNFLVKTKDNLQPTLVTLPILDRHYYNSFGYIYNPAYEHMFVDQEMTAVAEMTGRIIKSDIVIPHNHYTTGRFQKDNISSKNDRTWAQGEQLFNGRLKTNFGLASANIIKPYSEIKWR